jgi:hypothetical protein
MPVLQKQLNSQSMAQVKETLPVIAPNFAKTVTDVTSDFIIATGGNIQVNQWCYFDFPDKLQRLFGDLATVQYPTKNLDCNGVAQHYYSQYLHFKNQHLG